MAIFGNFRAIFEDNCFPRRPDLWGQVLVWAQRWTPYFSIFLQSEENLEKRYTYWSLVQFLFYRYEIQKWWFYIKSAINGGNYPTLLNKVYLNKCYFTKAKLVPIITVTRQLYHTHSLFQFMIPIFSNSHPASAQNIFLKASLSFHFFFDNFWVLYFAQNLSLGVPLKLL